MLLRGETQKHLFSRKNDYLQVNEENEPWNKMDSIDEMLMQLKNISIKLFNETIKKVKCVSTNAINLKNESSRACSFQKYNSRSDESV